MEKKFTLAASSLLELLLALTISALLIGLVLPGYRQLVQKQDREAAKAVLAGLSVELEDYYAQHQTYQGAPLRNSRHYEIRLHLKKHGGYQLIAAPLSAQASDACGWLSLDDQGGHQAKAPECW